MSEVKISALKALKISTKVLTKSQRQNYYCILNTLIKLEISETIRNETLSCFKEAAKYYKEEVNSEIIQKNNVILESNDIILKSKWLNALCCLGNEEYFFTIIKDNLCACLCKNQEETQMTLKCLR